MSLKYFWVLECFTKDLLVCYNPAKRHVSQPTSYERVQKSRLQLITVMYRIQWNSSNLSFLPWRYLFCNGFLKTNWETKFHSCKRHSKFHFGIWIKWKPQEGEKGEVLWNCLFWNNKDEWPGYRYYICLYRYQVIYTIDDKFNLLSVVADQGFDFRCAQPWASLLSKGEKISGIVAECHQGSDMQKVQNSVAVLMWLLKALLRSLGARKGKRQLASAGEHSREHSRAVSGIQQHWGTEAPPGPGLLQDWAGSGHQLLVPPEPLQSEGLGQVHNIMDQRAWKLYTLYRISIFKDTWILLYSLC